MLPEAEQPEAGAQEPLVPAQGTEQPAGAAGVSGEGASAQATPEQALTQEEFELLVGGKSHRVPRAKAIELAQKGMSYEQKMADLKSRETDLAELANLRQALAELEATDPDAAKALAETISAAWAKKAAPLPPELSELVEGQRRAKANAEHKAAFGLDLTDEEYAEVAAVAQKRRVPVEDAWQLAFGKKALAAARKSGESEAMGRLRAGQAGSAGSTGGGSAPKTDKPKSDREWYADLGKALAQDLGPSE